MKTGLIRLTALALALTGGLGLGAFNAVANLEVSATVQINGAADFYEPLAPNGSWVEVNDYGRCWHPAVAEGWRPYCDGTWVWTDCGWYWQSDEPWAWACYHYGSWAYDPHYGWVWVPGVEWAPAWVYWRTGGDYIGWAPCSPQGLAVAPGEFVFVEERNFSERHRPSTVIVNNLTVINKTRQIAESSRENRNIGGRQRTVVVNNGPDVNEIERATGRKLATVPVQEENRHTVVPSTVRHERNESPGGTKSPADQDQTGPMEKHDPTVPNRNLPPGEMPERPDKSVPPDRNLPPSKQEITPSEQPSHELPSQQLPSHDLPAAPSAPLPKQEIVPSPQPPPHEVPPHQTPPHEMPKTSPSEPPPKHEATPQQPSEPAGPPAGSEEKDKERQ